MPRRQLQVTDQQVQEWAKDPVTLLFKQRATIERDETLVAKGLGAFHPFEPQRTQEVLAGLNGAWDAWDEVIDALEAGGIMEELDEDSDEHQGTVDE